VHASDPDSDFRRVTVLRALQRVGAGRRGDSAQRQQPHREDVGYFAKFTYPTVVNGKVYVSSWGAVPPANASRCAESSTPAAPTNEGQLVVYGSLAAPVALIPESSIPVPGNSIAYAVNDRGEVTGVSDLDEEETVFLYRQGTMRDLHIRGHAFAINNAHDIVGTLTPPERGTPRGFLWQDGVLRDLNTLLVAGTYQIEVAYRINDRGQILRSGVSRPGMDQSVVTQGNLHALLLNPVGKSNN